jgi:hypothetical protein
MHKGPEGVAGTAAPEVLPPGVGAHIPAIVREAQRVVSPGLLGRDPDQWLELRIAADDPIQSDDVRGRQGICQRFKVAVAKGHPTLVAPPCRLLSRYFHIGTGRFEVDSAPHAAPEQLVLEYSNAGSDVQHRLCGRVEVGETLEDRPGRAGWSLAAISGEFLPGTLHGEVAIGRLAMTTRHSSP